MNANRNTRTLAAVASLAIAAAVRGLPGQEQPAQPAQPVPPAPVKLAITEVVVYEDRALVTREGDVGLKGGVETIAISGLPPALAETSLRAGLADPSKGRVVSVSSEVERRREIQDTRLRAAEDERRSLQRRAAEVEDDLKGIGVRDAYLGAYEKLVVKAVSERTGGGSDPETAKWGDALKFIRDSRAALQTARREAERRREDLQAQAGVMDAEVRRLRQPEERSTRTAEVAVEAKEAGVARMRLSYVIHDAGWSPRYDARFDAERRELEVTYFGEVRQRTGEDWQAAKLILSTARPSVGAQRPEMLPLRLAAVLFTEKEKLAERFERAGERNATFIDLPPEAAGTVVAALRSDSRENATSATFAVPGTATVPADGRPHKVPVVVFRERADTSFETVPSLQRFVYLKCSTRNASPHPMLAGPVDIFRGSGFIGTSDLKFTAPGRPFEVSLGIEESLKVRRAVVRQGWTGRGKEKREAFDIEVENFGSRREAVTVIEGYPVSDIEEVTVTLDASTTPPTEKSEKEGILRWRLDVPPGESRRVHVDYAVVYPKDYSEE